MKRSVQVTAPLVAAAALALMSGCRKPQMQRCVDEQNHVVPDSFCQNPQQQRNATGGYVPMYRYYYGGSGGYGVGTSVGGGTYTPMSGVSYSTSTSRGGFGSFFGGGGGSGGDAAGSGS